MKQNYERLSYFLFGKQLLETEDIDPIYSMLYHGKLPTAQLKRWCLAYWCFYSAGWCSFLSEFETPQFYEQMKERFKKAPRGAERRHFRGAAGLKSINWLEKKGTPEQIVDWIFKDYKYEDIAKRVAEIPVYGPWITWKIADMGERILGYPVDFRDVSLHIYKDPVQGAALVATGDWKNSITPLEVKEIVASVEYDFREYKAPPKFDRTVNIQEAETILCKYKAHVKGHYPLMKDTTEILHGLKGWGKTADKLKIALQSIGKENARL